MIGVTVFGLVFTPVFYVASRWVAAKVSRVGSVAGLVGHASPGKRTE